MSHFLTVVLVEADKFDPSSPLRDQAETLIYPLLKAYDENIEVEEYQTGCYCVSRQARDEARQNAMLQLGDIDDFRESFSASRPKGEDWFSDERQEAWKKHIAPLVELEEKFYNAHPLKDKPDENCDECSGTGKRMTTYNPFSKWDWYEVGGRWSGVIDGDIQPVKKLKEDLGFFALVTPDGQWYEQGEMGWFGMATNEKSDTDWKSETDKLFERHNECFAVAVDCHI